MDNSRIQLADEQRMKITFSYSPNEKIYEVNLHGSCSCGSVWIQTAKPFLVQGSAAVGLLWKNTSSSLNKP